jgi:phage shock protein A
MLKLFRRWWRYLTAKLGSSFEERADPKVQLEQAIAEAQDQHRRLKEQAANVIAHQKQTEIRLNRTMGELEKVNGNARQAVLMADEASKGGDAEKATQYTVTAESFANRLITLEREVEDLKQLHLQSTDAANQAKAAVQQNSTALQQKLAERQKLLSQLDQAKMQEQMNTAMASLSETVGQDVPTLNEVRDKIESRYARAKGMSELTESSVESRMLEVEQASMNSEAQARLAQIRAELGLKAGDTAGDTATGTAELSARVLTTQARPRSGSGPTRGRGPTIPVSTPSSWRWATGATWWTASATGGWTPSSPTSTPAGTRSTSPSRTGATT